MDTICAIATARATSAIGVIRVSGNDALSICDKIAKTKSGKLSESKSGQMRLCVITDRGHKVDEVLCAVFKAPNSYTGEDIVEINCHGGVAILDRVMRLLIKNGARSALGGEFTKRAFLNGKMDLLQAESVCDLINSTAEADAELALAHMSGRLSKAFDDNFNALVSLNTDILAYIDFPDEGLTDVSADTVLFRLQEVKTGLEKLEKSFFAGSVIRDGVDTVIAGAPNVGKSTLLNAILGYERAIVSDIEGTTRDVVSERAVMGKITLNLCDTAGLRDNAGDIEKVGIILAKERISSAGLVLAVFDGARELSDADRRVIDLCKGKKAIAVINKSDLPQKTERVELEKEFALVVSISAEKSEGIEKISDIIAEMFLSEDISIDSGMLITNARHYERVVKALEKVESAIETIENGFTPDLASIDITDAASELGQITGRSVTDKIIDDIFSKFCVGK